MTGRFAAPAEVQSPDRFGAQLAELVWDMSFESHTNVVEVAIKRLRAKLDGPYDRKLLHTIRGMGYVLELREETV